MPEERSQRKLTAILSADAVGYSRLMAEDEEGTARSLAACRRLIIDRVGRRGGRVVDAPGDNVLAEFPSVVDAVRCAVEIQDELERRNAAPGEELGLLYRIGVNLGDVLIEGDRIVGDGVNVAARLESLAKPGGICISGTAFDQVEGKLDLFFEDTGDRSVKNIPRPVRTYRVVRARGREQATGRRARLGRGALAAGLVAAAAAVLLAWSLEVEPPWGETGHEPIRSLAVLPLENLSGDPEQEYFADGMTEALISRLAKIDELRVVSRTSTLRYKGAQRPLPEIARELGVDAILEGSVLRAGDRVRITAQLIHAPSDHHLWSESYERDLGDVLRLQAEVARTVADQIQLSLSSKERAQIESDRSVDSDAYDAYLKGRFFWHRRTEAGFRRAIGYFERSIAADSGYAPAYAGLADAYALLTGYGVSPASEVMPRAEAAARQALAIDENLPEAHASLGFILGFYHWDWPGANQSLRRSIELDPRYALAHFWLGFLMSWIGLDEEAVPELERAYDLDPWVPIFSRGRARAYALAGDRVRAIAQYLHTIELNPDMIAPYGMLAELYALEGRNPEALETLRSGNNPYPEFWALAGDRERATQLLLENVELSQREYVDPVLIAAGYAALGEHDRAFAWLERSYRERAFELVGIGTRRSFDPLRGDPRFQDLQRRVGLPPPRPRATSREVEESG